MTTKHFYTLLINGMNQLCETLEEGKYIFPWQAVETNKKTQNIQFHTETLIVISLELLQISPNWRAYVLKSFRSLENGFYCNSELMASWQPGKHPRWLTLQSWVRVREWILNTLLGFFSLLHVKHNTLYANLAHLAAFLSVWGQIYTWKTFLALRKT